MNDDRETPARPAPMPSPTRIGSGASLFFLAGLFLVAATAYLRWTGLVPSGHRQTDDTVAAVYLMAVLMAGWVAVRTALAIREVIALHAHRARAAYRTLELVESQLLPALSRIAEALERQPAPASTPMPSGSAAERSSAVAEVRRAIADGRWDIAERLANDFALAFPDAPEGPRLAEEVAEGRASAVAGLRARLDAAREVRDPDRVLALRDEMAAHLRGESLREFDREVVHWLMTMVRKGLSELPLRVDVVDLATRVAERFDDTTEGASLRKSLPVLRRSVGLCPRCAKPYAGIDEACPECLAGVTAPRLARLGDDEPPPAEEPSGSDGPDAIAFDPEAESPFLDRGLAD